MSTNDIQVTDRILLRGVDATISENELRKELLKSYRGIKHVERWYSKDEYKKPRELVQVDFTSANYAENVLQNGYINIGSLRCYADPLKPSINLQNQLKNDKKSVYQSETLTNEQQVTNKILIHDFPTTIAENELKEVLSKTYRGVKYVKRWYQINDPNVPTERVQVDFMSPKDTETFIQDGYINIAQFCCPVTPYKASTRVQKHLGSDYGSDYQSEIYSEEEIVTDRILVRNVPITIKEKDFQQELSKTYSGIKQVTRWYFDDRVKTPMVCVQIDFMSPKYTEDILRVGFIINGKNRYKVRALHPNMPVWNEFESDTSSDYQSQIFSEQDILQTFEEQKQRLNELICRFDTQLNDTIDRLCTKAFVPISE